MSPFPEASGPWVARTRSRPGRRRGPLGAPPSAHFSGSLADAAAGGGGRSRERGCRPGIPGLLFPVLSSDPSVAAADTKDFVATSPSAVSVEDEGKGPWQAGSGAEWRVWWFSFAVGSLFPLYIFLILVYSLCL